MKKSETFQERKSFTVDIITGKELKDRLTDLNNILSDDDVLMYGPVFENKILNLSSMTLYTLKMIILTWEEDMDEKSVAIGLPYRVVRQKIDREKTLQSIINKCNSTNGISIHTEHFNRRLKDDDCDELLINAAQFVGVSVIYKS